MKYPRFKTDKKTIKLIEKMIDYIKETLYSYFIPFDIIGSITSPTKYIQFRDMDHKDLIIRVSNHKSKKIYYNQPNVLNIILKTELLKDEFIDKKLNEIIDFLKLDEGV